MAAAPTGDEQLTPDDAVNVLEEIMEAQNAVQLAVPKPEATSDISPTTSPDTFTKHTSASTSARSFTSKPTLPELLNFKTSSGSTVDAVQQIGTQYSKLGPLLLNDDTGAVTSAIVSQYQRDADAANQEILTRWLKGQGKTPVSWSTLTDVLKEVGLSQLSKVIQESLTISTTPTFVPKSEATSNTSPVTSPHTSSTRTSSAGASSMVPATRKGGTDMVQPTLHKSHLPTTATDLQMHMTKQVTPQQGQMTIQYVQAKIRQFEKRFNALKKSTRECLERLVPVKRVADALTSLPADELDEHKPFLESHLSALYHADDHSELFGTMNLHWNYQNYQLLDHLIREFNLEVVNSEMKTYKEDLQQFRKKTPLKLFCQSQKKKRVKPTPDFHEVVAEFDWPDDVTLEVVEEFRQEYADHYSLYKCAMMLAAMLPGSFIITWYIPGSIVEKLKVKVPTSILETYSVTKLEIAGECVYPKVINEDGRAQKFCDPGYESDSGDESSSRVKDEEALYTAAYRGDVFAVKRLISRYVNVNCKSRQNVWTPLMAASFKGHVNIVRLLIEAKAQINIQDENGVTALHIAAEDGNVDVVRLLIEAGAHVNEKSKDGSTALFIACWKGHMAVVQLLLQRDADVSICQKFGWTPLFVASDEGHFDTVRILIEAKAQVNTQAKHGWTALHAAAENGEVDVVRLLIEARAQVDIKTKMGETPLMTASYNGHVDILKTLIEAKAQINTQDEDGKSPLYIASQKKHRDVVDILLRNGADISQADLESRIPLYVASQKGYPDVVDILLQWNKSKINQPDLEGKSPLYIASEEGYDDVVDILLKNGADIDQGDLSGFTPLHAASCKGHNDVVETLVRSGADINLVSKRDQRPIDVARYERKAHIVRILEEAENI